MALIALNVNTQLTYAAASVGPGSNEIFGLDEDGLRILLAAIQLIFSLICLVLVDAIGQKVYKISLNCGFFFIEN